jgi:hypothetical protein
MIKIFIIFFSNTNFKIYLKKKKIGKFCFFFFYNFYLFNKINFNFDNFLFFFFFFRIKKNKLALLIAMNAEILVFV